MTNTDVNTITAGTAYRLMVRGDRSINVTDNAATPTNTTLRTTGTLHTGPLTVNNLSAVANEFNLFRNTYPAAVDMNEVIAASTNVNTAFYYIWDPTLSGKTVAVPMLPSIYRQEPTYRARQETGIYNRARQHL